MDQSFVDRRFFLKMIDYFAIGLRVWAVQCGIIRVLGCGDLQGPEPNQGGF